MILSGDIGGTKTNLAYYDLQGSTLVPVAVRSFPSQEYGALTEVLSILRRENPQKIIAAAFGAAGPIVDNHCKLTNLAWEVDGREVADALGLREVGLINDLAATAYGLLRLGQNDIVTLQEGSAQRGGTIGVIAAGTGLGGGALVWDGKAYRAMPSEGGHADFAARNELEMDLLRSLLPTFGHVGVERLVAGPGIVHIYKFFRSRSGVPEPVWLTRAMEEGDASAAISRAGIDGKDGVCEKTIDCFTTLYGAEAGNIALRFLATGGMYVAGGIAPKILSKIRSGLFLDAFLAKDTYRPLLESIPLHVVLNDKTALLGAAHYALMMTGAA